MPAREPPRFTERRRRAGFDSRDQQRIFSNLGFAANRTHVADKADALARERPDQHLLLAAVTDRRARCVESARQGGFRDDPAIPDVCNQLVLAHDSVAILHKEDQQVEHLRLDSEALATAREFAPVGVELD